MQTRRRLWNRLSPLLYTVALFLVAIGTVTGQTISAIPVATGLSFPVFATAPPGDTNRLFIAELGGSIKILNLNTGLVNATPFISIPVGSAGEQGLLGLAFDPNYASNGKFYVHYVANIGQGETRIVQYQVSGNPDIADTTLSTIKTLLTLAQPQTNHNGGWIGFSPRASDDHNLYIALGDGGNGDDVGSGHHEPGGNAQWNETLLGKMLRIHIDPTTGTYTIPSNNPFFGVADPVKKEIWLLGLRNPFRDSFDRTTGRLFIGDVGQTTREEVDVQLPSNLGGGENYGWRDREGLIQNPTYATATPTPTPVPPRTDPILDYPRSTGSTVIGGYVYRGAKLPSLNGTYVFGDYGSSEIFTLNYNGAVASNFQIITSNLFPIPLPDNTTVDLSAPAGFGEDANGEIYICDIYGGAVFKIVPALTSVVSRKTHVGVGPFDIDLPTTGPPGVECRDGAGAYTLVFTFANPLGSVGGRSVTAGAGTVNSASINASDKRQYIVNLTGVTNHQTTTVSLTNVADATSRALGGFSVSMGVLVGDITANGSVNSSDVSQTQFESGHQVTTANFRADVTLNGQINSSDVSTVQAQSGTSLPSSKRGR